MLESLSEEAVVQRCSVKKQFLKISQNSQENTCARVIVGKGAHNPAFSRSTPPLFKDSPFLEIQDVPTFYRPIGKTKVLKDSFNQLAYNFYPKSILILEEYL